MAYFTLCNSLKELELTSIRYSLKNIGMSYEVISGKLGINSNSKPFYKDTTCTGSTIRIKNCNHNALLLTPYRKLFMDTTKCVGFSHVLLRINLMKIL